MHSPLGFLSQSHHSGIERPAQEPPREGEVSRNRTIVGLKPIVVKRNAMRMRSRNRTIVGLKLYMLLRAELPLDVAIAP